MDFKKYFDSLNEDTLNDSQGVEGIFAEELMCKSRFSKFLVKQRKPKAVKLKVKNT